MYNKNPGTDVTQCASQWEGKFRWLTNTREMWGLNLQDVNKKTCLNSLTRYVPNIYFEGNMYKKSRNDKHSFL